MSVTLSSSPEAVPNASLVDPYPTLNQEEIFSERFVEAAKTEYFMGTIMRFPYIRTDRYLAPPEEEGISRIIPANRIEVRDGIFSKENSDDFHLVPKISDYLSERSSSQQQDFRTLVQQSPGMDAALQQLREKAGETWHKFIYPFFKTSQLLVEDLEELDKQVVFGFPYVDKRHPKDYAGWPEIQKVAEYMIGNSRTLHNLLPHLYKTLPADQNQLVYDSRKQLHYQFGRFCRELFGDAQPEEVSEILGMSMESVIYILCSVYAPRELMNLLNNNTEACLSHLWPFYLRMTNTILNEIPASLSASYQWLKDVELLCSDNYDKKLRLQDTDVYNQLHIMLLKVRSIKAKIQFVTDLCGGDNQIFLDQIKIKRRVEQVRTV